VADIIYSSFPLVSLENAGRGLACRGIKGKHGEESKEKSGSSV